LEDKLPDPSPRRDPNDNIKFEEEAAPVFEDALSMDISDSAIRDFQNKKSKCVVRQ
jgi:hypothetical protein